MNSFMFFKVKDNKCKIERGDIPNTRVFFEVSYAKKEIAKGLGMKFDFVRKQWYFLITETNQLEQLKQICSKFPYHSQINKGVYSEREIFNVCREANKEALNKLRVK